MLVERSAVGYPNFLGGSMRSTAADDAVVRSVRRACYGGLDSLTLRAEVARRLAPGVPYAAWWFGTTDPDTGLLNHGIGAGAPEMLVHTYLDVLYPQQEALWVQERVRAGESVTTATTDALAQVLVRFGLGKSASAFFSSSGALWGKLCLLRDSSAGGFTERELQLLRRLAPHVARGLRSGTLVTRARDAAPDAHAGAGSGQSSVPGVVVFDHPRRMRLCTNAAASHLEDLSDVGAPDGEPPCALMSAIGLLDVRSRRTRDGNDQGRDDALFHARGRSGIWYVLRASRAEPDDMGRNSTVVIIEPLVPRDVLPFLTHLYGLTPREREVVALVARGESTRCVGARLGLSEYTVQEHLGNACTKVGVRGRRALVAKLYYDAFSPGSPH
jgi:DNA-binding CsgD family transcriptional regulator